MTKIDTEKKLRDLYGFPGNRAAKKVFNVLDKHSRYFIEKSPFLLLSSCNLNGKMDVSPRGGKAGFVHVLNETTILLPDYKGNNRVDSLSNIVETGEAGLLFLIPGIDETIRINGKAHISTNQEYMDLFTAEGKPPISVLVIQIEETFLHCAKAFMRSQLWNSENQMDKTQFPSMGQMLKDQLGLKETPESRDEMVKRYKKDL